MRRADQYIWRLDPDEIDNIEKALRYFKGLYAATEISSGVNLTTIVF